MRWREMRRNSLNLPVTITQPTSGRCPSLPHWLHKEKSGETLIFIAFLLLQISFLLSIFIKASIQERSWCGFDSTGPALMAGSFSVPVGGRNQTQTTLDGGSSHHNTPSKIWAIQLPTSVGNSGEETQLNR